VNLADLLYEPQRSLADASGRVYGVVVGVVTDNQDPDKLGRVKVALPWLAPDAESAWARIATLMAGAGRGTFYLPEVGDEVLVAFEHGDPDYPYVLGALWNGQDLPPENNADGQNNKRRITSRSGLTILLDDTAGSEKIEIADQSGQTRVVVDVGAKRVAVESSGDVELSAPQGKVRIQAQAVEIDASGQMDLQASATLNVQGGTTNIKGGPLVNIN